MPLRAPLFYNHEANTYFRIVDQTSVASFGERKASAPEPAQEAARRFAPFCQADSKYPCPAPDALGSTESRSQGLRGPTAWVTLFAVAFARLAAREHRLRQSYLKFPFPHLYEHPESIATIAVERMWRR